MHDKFFLMMSFVDHDKGNTNYCSHQKKIKNKKQQQKTTNKQTNIPKQIEKVWFMVFSADFNNISAISWWSVLLVEENGVHH